MAFGSWFKNIIKKTGQFINKVKPYINTAVRIARNIAPALSHVGNIVEDVRDSLGANTRQKYSSWVPNERAKGFNIPLLKDT